MAKVFCESVQADEMEDLINEYDDALLLTLCVEHGLLLAVKRIAAKNQFGADETIRTILGVEVEKKDE